MAWSPDSGGHEHPDDKAILGPMTDPNEPDAATTEGKDPPNPAETPAAAAPSEDDDSQAPHPVLPKGASVATAAVVAPPVPMLAGRRQFARTSPVVVDRGRASFGLPSFGDRRQLGQIGLVLLMIAALGAILLARIGQPETPGLANGGSPSPIGSVKASPHATPHATASPSSNPGSSASSPAKTPGASPSSKPKTYKVKAGDTLSSIATRFHTTAKMIEQLNDLKSPFVIHPGQVLKLP